MAKSSRMPSQRQLQVGEAIRHALAEIFIRSEVFPPDFNGSTITVSEVRVSPDLRNARAFVMPLGGRDRAEVMFHLEEAAPQLRALVSKMVRLKFSPYIHFELDRSYDEANRINALLNRPEVAKDLD